MQNHNITPSHVAILVPSARKAADHLAQFGFQIEKEEIWEGEGTKEIYIEKNKSNSLLLMEPVQPGAYQRAMSKRGPGLHHLAIDVLDLESFIDSLAGTGWLLHPTSLKSHREFETVYLARPGFPGLIEVHGHKSISPQPLFITSISLQMDVSLKTLLKSIGLDSIVSPSSKPTELSFGGQTIQLKDLF